MKFWLWFAVLFAVLVLLELRQFFYDKNNFDPFWLGWNLAFMLNCVVRALDLRRDSR